MAGGTNTPPNVLWKCRYKVNTDHGSVNFSLHVAELDEAAARVIFKDIANRYKAILPSTVDLAWCVMSMDNPQKDGRMIPDVIGPGLYGQGGVGPVPTPYNNYTDVVRLRLEDDSGGATVIKIGPVPDSVIVAQDLTVHPTDQFGRGAAAPATAAQPVVYNTELTNLMITIVNSCCRVQVVGHVPGGAYTYFPYKNAIYRGIGKKKGGRVLAQ